MAEIPLRGLTKIASRRYLLDNVDMTMRDGELTVLVGDSECGKITTLKAIAGIDKISSGEIYVGGTAGSGLKGGRRNVAMVFEKQGLLPHKNVYDKLYSDLFQHHLEHHMILLFSILYVYLIKFLLQTNF